MKHPKRGTRYSQADRERARALLQQGYSPTEVARRIGCALSTLKNWATFNNWDVPDGTFHQTLTHDPELIARARALAEGPTKPTRLQVARTLGLPYNTITTWSRLGNWQWARNHQRDPHAGLNCATCKRPNRHLCSQHHLACEKPILVLDQPEDRLWARNGGRAAIEEAY